MPTAVFAIFAAALRGKNKLTMVLLLIKDCGTLSENRSSPIRYKLKRFRV